MMHTFSKIFSIMTLLVSFWSVFRVYGIMIFDLLLPISIGMVVIYGVINNKSVSASKFCILALFILSLGGFFSLFAVSSSQLHVIKTAKVIIGIGATFYFASLVSRHVMSIDKCMFWLSMSGTLSSVVCILQGQFGFFLGLGGGTVESWQRLTGLAEHPIEMGVASAISFFISLGLYSKNKRIIPYLPMALVCVYSMRYSASLTAVLGLCLSLVIYLLVMRDIKLIIASCIAFALLAGFGVSGSMLGNSLSSRVSALIEKKESYQTLDSRLLQFDAVLNSLNVSNVIVGKGFQQGSIGGGKGEIHNGFLAALYHFGLLGLLSQLLFFLYFFKIIINGKNRHYKAIALAGVMIFLLAYMSGPALYRRSPWLSCFLLTLSVTLSNVPLGDSKRVGYK